MEEFYFERQISDYDRELMDRLFFAPLIRGEKAELLAQREALKSHYYKDYHVQLVLATATPTAFLIVLTDSGYDFLLTSIRASFTGTVQHPPMMHVRDRGHGFELFKGDPIYPGFVSCFDTAPGTKGATSGRTMAEPLEKVHRFGNRSTIEIGAMMHPSDATAGRTVDILLTGWLMSRDMLVKNKSDITTLVRAEKKLKKAVKK